MARYKKRELIYVGVDYIKAFIKDLNTDSGSILLGLSVNSNQLYFTYNGISIVIEKESNGKFQNYFSIKHESISLGFICIDRVGGWNSFVEITGQCLTLIGTDFFYYLFSEFKLTFLKFKRIDLCFDMNLEINYFFEIILLPEFKEKNINFQPIQTKQNGIETMYFWKRDYKKNSYELKRIYNKILDSKNKGKLWLYDDKYKDENGEYYKDVTRFECELREDLVKYYKFESLKDNDFIFYRLVKSFYKFNSQFFKFLKKEDFEEYLDKIKKENKNRNEDIKNGQSEEVESPYQKKLLDKVKEKVHTEMYGQSFITQEDRELTIKTFLVYARKMFKNWIKKEEIIEIINLNLINE